MNISIREAKKQVKLIISAMTVLVALVVVAVDALNGNGGQKVDVPKPASQVGQVSGFSENTSDTSGSHFTYARVTKVVDGDTITVKADTKLGSGTNDSGEKYTIRLIGINTPETVDPRKSVECFGKESSAEAKRLLEGRIVKLEYDDSQDTRDKYGRLLAYAYVVDAAGTEIFFNKHMIEEGYAYEYTYDKAYKYQKEFKAAQAAAEAARAGLWSTNTCDGRKSL